MTAPEPPPGWFPFGWHAEHRPTVPGKDPVRLLLSWTHLGENGLPLWEIPVETGDPALFPISYATTEHTSKETPTP